MPETFESDLLQTRREDLKQPAVLDDGGCFEPFIPNRTVSSAAKGSHPEPRSIKRVVDKVFRDLGYFETPPDTTPKASLKAAAADADKGDAETGPSSTAPGAQAEEPLPPPRVATSAELFTWIKQSLLAQTPLSEGAADLVSYWVISTWFQEGLNLFPCLVITGAAHDAHRVLHALSNFCRQPALLAGFGRCHLKALRWCRTHLISEPNLDKRTADLLSNLTDRKFLVVTGSSVACHAKSAAIYAGEDPATHKIQNSIHLHIAVLNTEPPTSPQWLQTMIERIPVHLDQYRSGNIHHVQNWTWAPSGLSSETATIARELGRCIVDAPELWQKLTALLKAKEKQNLSEISSTTEAIVLETTRTLSRDGREHAYVREIAAEVNRLLEARGETTRLSPEKVGHRLKKLGLRTRPLSQAGHGLIFDKPTLARIQQLAGGYLMEEAPTETENLHGL